MKYHTYEYYFGPDGDYIILCSLEQATAGNGWHKVEHTRWLIPGTELED